MPHPIMFDDADPVLARLRTLALGFPEATEKVAHGRPTFRCGKIFAQYGGGEKGGPRHDTALMVLPDPTEAPALAADARFFVPAYIGAYGWLGVDLDDCEWGEVGELLDASFRLIAPARAIRALDARGSAVTDR